MCYLALKGWNIFFQYIIMKANLFACIYIHNKIMTQAMICNGCKKHYGSQYNTKTNSHYKTCADCRNINNVRKYKHQLLHKTMKAIFQVRQAHNILSLQFQIH